MVSSQAGGGMGANKWSPQVKKVETSPTTTPQMKTPYIALSGPQPAKNIANTKDKRVQCFKCKGYGHYARECFNQRVMVIGLDENIFSEDEEEEKSNLIGRALSHDSKTVGLESDDELIEGMQALVVLRMLNVQPKHEEHNEEMNNIFHMKCKVKTKGYLVMIDGGSCTNVVSELLVTKLDLNALKHHNPYKLQ